MLEDLKNLNDLGGAIKKAFKEVGPDAIKYVSAVRLKDVIVLAMITVLSAILASICIPWAISVLLENDMHFGGVVLAVAGAVGFVTALVCAGGLINEIGNLIINWRNPQADAVSYWADNFRNQC